jgi:outer membrane protein TolC
MTFADRFASLWKRIFDGQALFDVRLLMAVPLSLLMACETLHNAEISKVESMPAADPLIAEPVDRVSLPGYELADFVDFALTNRPEVAAAKIAVESRLAAIASVESGRPFMPHLDMSANYAQSTANGGSHYSGHNSGRFNGSVALEMLLVDFGRYDADLRAACEDLAAAEMTLAETRLNVFEEVSTSYFTLLMNDALLDVARTNEWECINHLSQATNRFENGEAKLLDVLRARLDLSEAVQARISASNDTVTAGAEFLRALGLSADRASREDVVPPSMTGLDFTLKEFELSGISAVEALAFARTNSPALMVKRAQLRIAMNEVDWAVADLFPELKLSSSFNFADPAWNWSWAFGAAQSLFLGWRKTTAVDAAVLRMRSARMDVEAAERTLSRDLAVAVANRDDSVASLAAARTSVRQAYENLRVADEQYRLGEASRIDYTTAVSDYAVALGKRVKAFYEGQLAEARIMRLIGAEPLYHHTILKEQKK